MYEFIPLKITLEKVIECSDWDGFVTAVYGRPYNLQQQDGCKSRGIHRFSVPDEGWDHEMHNEIPEIVNDPVMGVQFAVWLARDPKQPMNGKKDWQRDLWWTRNFYPDFQTLANDLHAKGLLEAGNYIINIDW